MTLHLRLILDVRYDLNGECKETAKEMLGEVVTHATNRGLLTGSSAMEVDSYHAEIVELS